MLDQFFYIVDQTLFGHGSDRDVMLLFACLLVLIAFAFFFFRFIRILQSFGLFVGLAAVSFFPVFAFPSQIDGLLLRSKIITLWYISHSPQFIRTWTVWIAFLILSTTLFFVFSILSDICFGRPLTWKSRWARLQRRSDELAQFPLL